MERGGKMERGRVRWRVRGARGRESISAGVSSDVSSDVSTVVSTAVCTAGSTVLLDV